jgi:hypothetical protein
MFIDLNRSFLEIPKDHEFLEEEYESPIASGLLNKKKWDDLLTLQRVIILAEAGAGKTEEIRATTKRLRNEGKKAFFFRLEQLGSDFESSFEIGDNEEFVEWLNSGDMGWFFLDSVDEARLRGPKQFEAAIRKFGVKLGDSKQRAHIYITSRLSEWQAKSDLSLIKDRLSFFELVSTTKEQSIDDKNVLDGSSSIASTQGTKGERKPIEPMVFALCPLDQDQINTFSKASGLQETDAFFTAIQKAEADIFSRRPQDLIELINYWKQYGEIANRAELIKASISSKLIEMDPARATALPLNLEEAMYGAELIAAAVTFLRKNRILVPDQNADPTIKTQAIDAQTVLTSWSFEKIRALLQRPIFDDAIYGTVRFHHRSVHEYLTARWLHRLLLHEKSRRAIESIFFTERYGRQILVPSMRPILAWLILFDDRIQEKTAIIAPEVFMQGGDPSALSTDVRERMLRKFCNLYAKQKAMDLSFGISELRRFAHPDLGQTVSHLLKVYSDHDELQQLLLRIVWQGDLHSCAEQALEYALQDVTDIYTRIYGIRAVASAGSEEQKNKLVAAIIADPNVKNEKFIGELIDNFAPNILGVQDILALLQRIEKPEIHPDSWLSQSLKEFCVTKCPNADINQLIQGISRLLKQPPIIERHYFEVSQQYSWLLPYSALAAERLVRAKHPDALEGRVIETISLAQAATTFDPYILEKHTLSEMVPEWSELNRTLFWFDVSSARQHLDKTNGERLIYWWQTHVSHPYWRFTDKDFEDILEDIVTKPNVDDRLVALSLSFHIYKESGRDHARRLSLKKAVNGIPELEKALNLFLNPPRLSDEGRRWRHTNAAYKRRQTQREKTEADNRRKWRDWLQSNTSLLRDTSIAARGSAWNATNYLMHELKKKRESSSKWALPNWEDLIAEFGQDVAEAYRDGCIEYWRKYRPKIRSEGIENPNSTPYAVIVGLSGLEIEARHIANWPRNLSEHEAELACRYAVNELNGFPEWLPKLHAEFPGTVEAAISREIEWEFSEYDGEAICHYVLSDVAWQADWLKPGISYQIVSFLNEYEPKHDDTVKIALGIVLAIPGLDQAAFIDIAKARAMAIKSHSRLALWLAAWMCLDAKGALDTLNSLLSRITDTVHATELCMMFIVALLGGRREHVKSEYRNYIQTEILLALIKLMHTHIRSSEDIDRANGRPYSPGLRDDAQDARSQLFRLLQNIPGKPTYLALVDLSKHHPDNNMREWYAVHAKRRAESDAEADPWLPEDISCFAAEAARSPQNHRELFDTTVSRLLDLKADLEDGDTSFAEILQSVKDETKHRNVIGGWLRDHSHGRYSVPQEEELADAKKPDIRVHGIGFDGPIPIELKVADNNWSIANLTERLNNQLCGQYLRDVRSNFGIFLLVYLGKQHYWRHPKTGKHLNFHELVQLLKLEAKKIIDRDKKIEAIEIVGIDLTKRKPHTVKTKP